VADDNKIEEFLAELQKKLKGEMPRIEKEIEIYKEKLLSGRLKENPTPSPQFN
jgi:hypothetical protein